jgi:hypothetical protein
LCLVGYPYWVLLRLRGFEFSALELGAPGPSQHRARDWAQLIGEQPDRCRGGLKRCLPSVSIGRRQELSPSKEMTYKLSQSGQERCQEQDYER